MKIAFVTDSTADIPADLAQENDIRVVANLMTVDGHDVEDGKGISREEFYTRLPLMKTLPTTGTASSGIYERLYEALFQEGADAVLSIHASGQISGIVNAANAAAVHFGERVRVIDSQSITLGLGFQVLAAVQAARQGASLQALLELLERTKNQSRVIAMLDTLEYVRRSGRVSWAKAQLGNLLRIKPFVEISGGLVHSLGEVRTRRKGTERLIELLQRQGPLEWFAVLHTNSAENARQFLASLDIQAPHPPLIVNITTIVGAHVGPNALGFAALTADV